MNITDVDVSPSILSFQSFLSLGRIKLEDFNLIIAMVRLKIWLKKHPKVTDSILISTVSIWCVQNPQMRYSKIPSQHVEAVMSQTNSRRHYW